MFTDILLSSTSLSDFLKKQQNDQIDYPQKQGNKHNKKRDKKKKQKKELQKFQQNSQQKQIKSLLISENELQDFEQNIPKEFIDVFNNFNNKSLGIEEENKQIEQIEQKQISENESECSQIIESNRNKKQISRLSLYEIKMMTSRPDLVENWDVTAHDPLFLQKLKQVRNSVPVPCHWNQKRAYLQYKKGINKRLFKLPEFIENTGVCQVRKRGEDDGKSLKQRMRERIQPKMGKIEIDYNILHDAFFKFQRTPKLTKHGQIYKEGSENEIKREGVMAGRLSPSLLDALGIASQCPPPWILNMQKYGPPPGYPTLKIPGVNMPIPGHIKMDLGGLFSDERGNTVYADCHGLNPQIYKKRMVSKIRWGELDQEDGQEEELGDDLLQSSEDEQ